MGYREITLTLIGGFMRLSGLRIVLVVAATAIACSGVTPPASIPGVFVLQSVNGDPLPAEVGFGPGGPPSILSGTFTLNADGSGVVSEVIRPSLGTPVTSTMQVRYDLDGYRITITRTACPPNALCIPFEGALVNRTLQLDRAVGSDAVIYLYHRVDDDIPNL